MTTAREFLDRSALRLASCLLAMAPAFCAAVPLESVTFDVVRAWFDDDTVYVKYRRTYVRKAAFSLSIRGKVEEIKSASYIVTLPRAGLSTAPTTLRMVGGEPADDVEYRDRDFVVTRRDSALTVKGHDAQTDLDGCMPYWWDAGLARTDSGLLICGSFVGKSGRVEWQISPPTIQLLMDTLGAVNQRGPAAVAKAFPVLAPTFVGGRVMITTDWTAVHPTEIRVAYVDPAHPDAPTFESSRMAAAASYFGMQNARPVYSPSMGYVVNNGSKQNVSYAFCEVSRCTPMPVSTRYAYMLVDGTKRLAYHFEQANTSVSDLRIGRIDW